MVDEKVERCLSKFKALENAKAKEWFTFPDTSALLNGSKLNSFSIT